MSLESYVVANLYRVADVVHKLMALALRGHAVDRHNEVADHDFADGRCRLAVDLGGDLWISIIMQGNQRQGQNSVVNSDTLVLHVDRSQMPRAFNSPDR